MHGLNLPFHSSEDNGCTIIQDVLHECCSNASTKTTFDFLRFSSLITVICIFKLCFARILKIIPKINLNLVIFFKQHYFSKMLLRQSFTINNQLKSSFAPFLIFSRSNSSKKYDHHRNYQDEKPIDWFPSSEKLVNARKEAKAHLVFLEGPQGSGKKDVLNRLQKLGYSTVSPDFYSIIKSKGSVEGAEEEIITTLYSHIDSVKNDDQVSYMTLNLNKFIN